MHKQSGSIYQPKISGNDSMLNYSVNKYKLFGNKKQLFDSLGISNTDIVFLGNSITESFPVTELFNDLRMKNRGMSGCITSDISKIVYNIVRFKPRKVFIMTGINDIYEMIPKRITMSEISNIVNVIKKTSPKTEIYIESILPVSDKKQIKKIIDYNTSIKAYCKINDIKYINIFDVFFNGVNMSSGLTYDGTHLTAAGIMKLKGLLAGYIN